MQSPCIREVTQVCLHGCCPSPLLKVLEPPPNPNSKTRSTSAISRQNFVAKTAASFFPNTRFTNHESLPSLEESFIEFQKAYPQYSDTNQVDQIRAKEYYHLSISNHVCLDYIGIGLFSYFQLQHQSSSSITPIPLSSTQSSGVPVFSTSYKSANLKTVLLHGGQVSELESAIKKRIMDYLNISENDYSMVFTANRTSAFKVLAESYPFQSSRKLLTVYDYESEAVESLINSSEKRGARAMSAEFSWSRLKIQSAKLKKLVVSKRKKRKKRGLFVFPLQSRITGARYPYLWMKLAQENGWHVLLDACALGPKDMDCFGISLIRPDFLICSLYKVFGDNPSGFACLFVKKSTVPFLESSVSGGIVTLVPIKKLLRLPDESSGTDTDLETISKFGTQEEKSSSFSGPIPIQTGQFGIFEQGEPSEQHKPPENEEQKEEKTLDPEESKKPAMPLQEGNNKISRNGSLEIECRGLDHVDSLGLITISNRSRYLINWLISALMKLQHPNTEERTPLVRIYGPKIKFDRAPALAFNVFDWKGEKVEPVLVQKLADRSNISLSYGFLHQIWFPEKYQAEKERILEKKETETKGLTSNKRKDKVSVGISVVTAAVGFLANFEDMYRLWAFVAQFLDADFVEKERWRYTALNQKTIEI